MEMTSIEIIHRWEINYQYIFLFPLDVLHMFWKNVYPLHHHAENIYNLNPPG